MIFVRSPDGPLDRSVNFVRTAALIALIAYPAGALALTFADDTLATTLVGYGLILVALTAAATLTRTSLQRIVSEEAKALDEFELQMRHRAMSVAYTCLSVLALSAILYAGIASDIHGWLPTTFDHYNGLFWGAFLYCFTLPTACLAWLLDASTDIAA